MSRGTEQESLSPRLLAADVVLLAAALALALSPLIDVYAGRRWTLAAVGGVLLGSGVCWVAGRFRWGPWATVGMAFIGYLVLGPLLAVPRLAVGNVLPGPDAVRELVLGLVQAWRTSLTRPVPLSSSDDLIVPFVLALIGALAATALLWRSRWPGAAGFVVLSVFATAAAFGTRGAANPTLRGILLVALLLLWLRWRSLRHLRTSWVRRVSIGIAVVVVSGGLGWGLTGAVAGGGTREVLRDHIDPPLSELAFKSPLARYRDYYKDHKNEVLFTFKDVPAGDPLVRLASMDILDGIVWNVATEDLISGTSPFRLAPGSDSANALTVEVGAYVGPWVPSVGTATGVELVRDGAPGARRELLINTASGSIAEYGDTRAGDVFRIDWAPRPDRSSGLLTAEVDPAVPIPILSFPAIQKLDTLTQRWVSGAGASTAFEKAVALEEGFRENGYFNDGLDADARDRGYSAAGHGAKRLADLVEDPARMVGNDEQYASAMAYAAQRLGLPTRVVLGFEQVRADGTVTGDDIAAWVEIAFAQEGWISFDPTPEETRIPPPLDEDPEPTPQPYVVQPPTLPQEPAELQGTPQQSSGRDLSEQIWDAILTVLRWVWFGVKIALLLSPLWLVLLVKSIRRRRRRYAEDPVVRLSGGWREFTDRLRDLGVRAPHGCTRHESGVVLADRFPETGAIELAAIADSHVFGPGVPSDEQIDAFWTDLDAVLRRMKAEVPWWRRILARFSPASFSWRDTTHYIVAAADRAGHRLLALPRMVAARRRSTSTQVPNGSEA